MSDESPEPSFADYVATENAKDRDEAPAEAVTLEPAEAPALPETPVEVIKGEQETPEAPGDEPEKPEKPRAKDGTFKKVSNTGEWVRNRKLTAELHQLQDELARMRAQPAPAAPPPSQPAGDPAWSDPSDPEPAIDKYLDKPDPYATLAVEAAKWAVRDAQRQIALQQHEQARREARSEVESRITAFAETHPDYQQKVAGLDDVMFQEPVLQAIADDDLGPDVVYHLASHPEEARRIAALTPLQGVKEIGKLLLRVSPADSAQAPAVPVSRAKPPIKPVGSSPVSPAGTLDPETTPFGDWVRAQNAADRKRRRDGI